jgi:transcriptional regulator NrdR family protein
VNCPKCQGDSSVTETRAVTAGVRRRRRCDQCNEKFSTVEQVVPNHARYDEPMIFVPKKALLDAIENFSKLVEPVKGNAT